METKAAGSAEPGGHYYQVFLSFRGPDTRQGFTDCLYHFLTSAGVRVFRDDREQPLGAEIEKILDAIGCSAVCIPIFSKTFAKSEWCLEEVKKMVELKKTIIPIFFDVEPKDVKLERSLYADDLETHGQPDDMVVQWKKALVYVGGLSGREVKTRGFGEFSKVIASEVLSMLKAKDKIIAGPLVATEDHVGAVMDLLNVDSPDVRFVGIHGMGGIGKTTLAKLVFNELSCRFKQCCSFVDDIREVSKSDPTKLQMKLLGDVTRKFTGISDTEDGVKKIRDMLCQEKVLIVLDDVDHREQIDRLAGNSSWFGPGSRIIITTRDKSILERERPHKIIPYEMVEMNCDQALQLFSKHAFEENHPPADYLDLSKEAVFVVGRLPLALEIIGSHLRGKRKEEWKQSIRALDSIPHEDVQKKLRLSYDSLDFRAQQMFLDIACFFNNKDKKNAMSMWEACDLRPESAIERLLSMSLIKFIDHDKLWMHDQLRDLGREIVCMENFFDIGKRSRLWEHREAIAVLKRREGSRKILALCLSEDASCFGRDELQRLRNLRFLEWKGIKVHGDLKDVFSRLVWFSWHFCPTEFTATGMNLERLVILELLRGNIDENWAGWTNMQVGDELKVLDLTGCKEMKRTPDFSKYGKLERLILEDCEKLVEIDGTIGNLKRLKYLNLKGCYSLSHLPEELCSLDALEEIIMKGKRQEFRLPELLGHLRSLLVLEVVGVHICKLPCSVGELQMLVRLSLCGCFGLRELPESVGNLNSLVELDLSETDIKVLPCSIGRLKMLRLLYLNCCEDLRELPDSLGDLMSLTELDLSRTGVTCLTDSIGYLSELKVLKVVHTVVRTLPRTIGRMVKLEELHASECDLMEVPSEIEKLPLRVLDLSGCGISNVPSLSGVTSLQSLLLEDCDELKQLPKLSENLSALRVKSLSLQALPDFSKLGMLKTLKLSDSSDRQSHSNQGNLNLEGIERLTKLSVLELHLSNVKNLPTNFGTFVHLKVLAIACLEADFQILQLPSTLSKLHLQYFDVKTRLPSLSHLKILVWLVIKDCKIGDGLERLGIEELHSLTSFSIEDCSNLGALHHLKLPKSLEKLWVLSCHSLATIPDLSELQNLQRLDLSYCEHLTGISGLEKLKTLETLSISGCTSLSTVSDLSGLRNLKTLQLSDYPQLSEISGLGGLESLEILRVTHCCSLKWLRNLPELIKLEELEVRYCESLTEIGGINGLSLRKRIIGDCESYRI